MLAAGCRRCSPGLAAGLDSGAPKIGTGLRLPGGGLHCAGPAQRDHRIDARVGGKNRAKCLEVAYVDPFGDGSEDGMMLAESLHDG